MHLPAEHFPEPRRKLEQYLHDAYLPYSLRREEAGQEYEVRYRFDVPFKGLKKKVVFDGFFEIGPPGFYASLGVYHRLDLMAFFAGLWTAESASLHEGTGL